MDELENRGHVPSHAASRDAGRRQAGASASDTSSFFPTQDTQVPSASQTGSLPQEAAPSGEPAAFDLPDPTAEPASPARETPAPRYVRRRAPHRSQGTVDDLTDDSVPHASYTHDSNIAVGGSTPLSGMAYRRSRNNMSRVKSGSRYGQYLEIPKGRRSIFASRERARRRRSVLALAAVVALLILAGMFLWSMMQQLLG